MHRTRYGSTLILLLLPLLVLAGCDAIAEAAGVDEVDVSLDEAGQNIPVASTAPAARSASVDRDGTDVPDVFDVESIEIDESDVSYTPLASSKNADSGTISVWIVVEGIPAVQATVAVENDAVTSITPNPIAIVESVNEEAFEAAYDDLSEESQYALASDWKSLSLDDATDRINDALRSSSFEVTVQLASTGDLLGRMSIDDVTFHLDF